MATCDASTCLAAELGKRELQGCRKVPLFRPLLQRMCAPLRALPTTDRYLSRIKTGVVSHCVRLCFSLTGGPPFPYLFQPLSSLSSTSLCLAHSLSSLSSVVRRHQGQGSDRQTPYFWGHVCGKAPHTRRSQSRTPSRNAERRAIFF